MQNEDVEKDAADKSSNLPEIAQVQGFPAAICKYSEDMRRKTAEHPSSAPAISSFTDNLFRLPAISM